MEKDEVLAKNDPVSAKLEYPLSNLNVRYVEDNR